MRRRESLKLAFDLINQTVRACYDGEASIRVLGPLLVAEQNLRAEVSPEAIEAGARAMAPEQISVRERPRLLPTFLDELQWRSAAVYASAADWINKLISAVRRRDTFGGSSGWARGVALTAAAFAGYIVLTAPSPQPREEAQLNVTPIQAEPVAPPAPVAKPSDNAVVAAAPPPRPRRARTRRPPRAAPVAEAKFDTSVQESEEVVVRPASRPVWARMPSERQLAELYPPRALEHGREGEARLHCVVIDEGQLDCARVDATSRSFGYAAMLVSRTLRHVRRRADGSTTIGTPVHLRVVFLLEDRGRDGEDPRPRLIVRTSET